MSQRIDIIGNVGNEPEMRYTPSGVPYAKLSIAVNKKWTGKDGVKQEKTTWFNCTCWQQKAELVAQWVKKKHQIRVIGEMEMPRVYTDKNGEHKASLDVTVNEIELLNNPRDDNSNGGGKPNSEAPSPATVEDQDIPF